MEQRDLGEAGELERHWEFRTRGSVAWCFWSASYPDSASVTILEKALEGVSCGEWGLSWAWQPQRRMIRGAGSEPLPRPVCAEQRRGPAPYTLTFPGAGRGCWDTWRGVKLVPALGRGGGAGRLGRSQGRRLPFSTSLWMLSPAHSPPTKSGH